MKMLFLLTLLAVTALVSCQQTIKTVSFNLNEPIARQLPWSILLSGTTGARSGIPRRMQTYGCMDRVFVSYSSHVGQYNNPQYPELFDEDTRGHVAEFKVSATGVPTFVKDVKFDKCVEMGNIFATSDCKIISVLCRSKLFASDFPGSIDLMEKAKNQTGSYPFGWVMSSVTSTSDPNYRIIDNMFLFEFSSGVVSTTPSAVMLVSRAIGGWNYGHWEVALNALKNTYFISLKTTIGPSWHEGAVTFRFKRGTWEIIKPEWACGTGHVLANRVTYSATLDKFVRYCWTDWSYEMKPNGIFYSTADSLKRTQQLRYIPVRKDSYWNGNGGPGNLIATPTGFLASAIGPGGEGNPGTIGIISLPGNHDSFNGNVHYYKWLDIPGNADNVPINSSYQIGFPNLQHFGKGGENSTRFLVGWATGVRFKGIPTDFFVAEIDTNGCVYGNYTKLPSGGWGQDDVWGYSPSSGCVVMPYTWIGSPANAYADCNNCTKDKFSSVLYLTTICPSGNRSTTKTCKFLSFRDPPLNCTDKLQNQDETGVDCGGSCTECPPLNLGKACLNSCPGGGRCSYCGGAQCCRIANPPDSCRGLGCNTTHCCTQIPLAGTGKKCWFNADCLSLKCVNGVCA